jgi:hypothetical protein
LVALVADACTDAGPPKQTNTRTILQILCVTTPENMFIVLLTFVDQNSCSN